MFKSSGWVRRIVSFVFTLFVSAQVFALGGQGQSDVDEWLLDIEPRLLLNLLRNVSPFGTAPGAVIASPSRHTPNYYYHWVRDASLVMDVLVDKYAKAKSANDKALLQSLLNDFISFSKRNQSTWNWSGGLGEPKFNVDGTAFNEPWGRPQNDGPALRALALSRFAFTLIAEGKKELVRSRLYSESFDSIIKADLEYVSHRWYDTCFDLWEEIRGRHFYTLMTQRASLIEGSRLARELGDHPAADWYHMQVVRITNELNRFWDSSRKIVVQTLDRDDGADYKQSQLDTATVLATLHSTTQQNDGFFGVNDDRIQATVVALENVFNDIYAINNKGGIGIAIGRYPEDRYNGKSAEPVRTLKTEGNPWFLTTLALAEYYYRLAVEIREMGHITITKNNQVFWSQLGIGEKTSVNEVVEVLREKGDEFVLRVRFHMGGSHMSEQINRYTGYMESAVDLTWNYASFLTAIDWRKKIQ